MILYYFALKDDDIGNGQSYTIKNKNESLYLGIELMQISLKNVLKVKEKKPYFSLLILCIKLQEECVIFIIYTLYIEIWSQKMSYLILLKNK